MTSSVASILLDAEASVSDDGDLRTPLDAAPPNAVVELGRGTCRGDVRLALPSRGPSLRFEDIVHAEASAAQSAAERRP